MSKCARAERRAPCAGDQRRTGGDVQAGGGEASEGRAEGAVLVDREGHGGNMTGVGWTRRRGGAGRADRPSRTSDGQVAERERSVGALAARVSRAGGEEERERACERTRAGRLGGRGGPWLGAHAGQGMGRAPSRTRERVQWLRWPGSCTVTLPPRSIGLHADTQLARLAPALALLNPCLIRSPALYQPAPTHIRLRPTHHRADADRSPCPGRCVSRRA